MRRPIRSLVARSLLLGGANLHAAAGASALDLNSPAPDVLACTDFYAHVNGACVAATRSPTTLTTAAGSRTRWAP